MRSASFIVVCTALAGPILLAGCAFPLVVGAGAAAATVGLQDRAPAQTGEDLKLKLQLKDALIQQNLGYLSDVGIDVYYGHVLLTGMVPSIAESDRILAIVKQLAGVKQVHNELFIGGSYSATRKAKDALISAQIQPRLLGDKNAFPLNYITTVVNGHLYILGRAATQGEHDYVIHLLSTIGGVAQVHDYLLVGAPPP